MPDALTRFYDLGPFRLDAATCLLFRDGKRVSIRPKASEILRVLVRHHGELVERDLLLGEVWPEANVEEGNISQYILELRKLFRPVSNGEEWIETVPRRGYRFVGLVRAVEESHATSAADTGLDSRPSSNSGQAVAGEVESRAAAYPLALKWGIRAAVGALLMAGLFVGDRLLHPPRPRVLNYVEITHDRLVKPPYPLTADSSRIYFESSEPGGVYSVPIAAGEATLVKALEGFTDPDLSPDGSKFVAARDGALPYKLWVIPVDASPPHGLSGLRGYNPVWSPDGKEIAYAEGPRLIVADADGSDPRIIVGMSSDVSDPRWSPDGKSIRFTVDFQRRGSAIWEVQKGGKGLHQVIRAWERSPYEFRGRWTADGRYFIFVHRENERGNLWARQEKCGAFFWECGKLFQLAGGPDDYEDPLPSSDGTKIYSIRGTMQMQLVRYDRGAGAFVPYPALAGTPAGELDFSRDGNWIAYLNLADHTIWRCRTDGREKRQLTFPPVVAALPHWSPDGKLIAFFDQSVSHFKASIVPSAGGPVTRLLPGETEEGVPTWSPDGKLIAYGEPLGRAPSTMKIHVLDRETRQVTDLPESEGLWTARWSPDGRYIAALVVNAMGNAKSPELRLFNLATKQWNTLAKVDSIEEPTWSRDNRFVYFHVLQGPNPALYRVRIADRRLERLVGLKGMSLGAGWSGVAPDGSPLIVRSYFMQEIYALEMKWP